MQFSHLQEALSSDIKKNFTWAHPQITILDLDQLRALIQDGQEKEICREWLQQKEEEKLQTLHYEKRHIEWLGGRVCAKLAALRYLLDGRQGSPGNQSDPAAAMHASDLLIMSRASGRPFLSHTTLTEALSLPHISISHSKGYAVAVAASNPCGIDIQAGSASLIRVKDRFCSREEEEIMSHDLKQLHDPDHLTLLWAAKEAVKKSASLERMPGFLDLALIHIETTARDGLVSWAPRTAQERPLPETNGPGSFLFTLAYQDSHEENRPHSFHSHHQFQVTVGLHQGYGIGLCVTPSHPGANNA